MPKLRIAIATILFIAASAGCNSHAYYTEAMKYHALAQDVLIKNGVCANKQDCQAKGILFAEGGEVSLGFASWGGAYINLYETHDTHLVDVIAAEFKELHSQLETPDVTLTVYSSKHLEPKIKFREVLIK